MEITSALGIGTVCYSNARAAFTPRRCDFTLLQCESTKCQVRRL
jgi:hypothetical protein